MSRNHRGKPQHKRKNNHRGKKRQKGPKSPDDERIWRRLIPYIDDFSRSYQKRDLLDLIESKDNKWNSLNNNEWNEFVCGRGALCAHNPPMKENRPAHKERKTSGAIQLN